MTKKQRRRTKVRRTRRILNRSGDSLRGNVSLRRLYFSRHGDGVNRHQI